MSYRFADSLRAVSGRNCSSILILLQKSLEIIDTHIIIIIVIVSMLHFKSRNEYIIQKWKDGVASCLVELSTALAIQTH